MLEICRKIMMLGQFSLQIHGARHERNGTALFAVVQSGGVHTWVEFSSSPLDRVHWYNHRRLLDPLGYLPPTELGAAYFDQLHEAAIAAWLKQISLREIRGGSLAASVVVLLMRTKS